MTHQVRVSYQKSAKKGRGEDCLNPTCCLRVLGVVQSRFSTRNPEGVVGQNHGLRRR